MNGMKDDLRTRIAALIERGLAEQLPSDLPDRYREWIEHDQLADVLIRELKLAPGFQALADADGIIGADLYGPNEPDPN